MNELPTFLFQREYYGKWMTYSEDELLSLNKAVKRNQKTVTLSSNDTKKKITVNFEKMIQKNSVTGFEQQFRCLLFNSPYIVWSWKDDYENWISFGPRSAILLEIAYEKKLKTIDLFIKDSYEFNLEEFFQKNKRTEYVRAIRRETAGFKYPSPTSFKTITLASLECKNFIQAMSRKDFDGVKAAVFNLLFSPPSSSSKSPRMSLTPVPSEIITALSAEAQASSSVQNVTSASVDPVCPKAEQYHVYVEEDNVYNATLNFTNVVDNSNKFFIIQLLKENKCNKYAVWFHWGRLGYKGQTNLVSCGNNIEEAKSVFEKKFYEKTSNKWSERKNFKRVHTKYDLVLLELKTGELSQSTSAVSKLDMKIQELLQMICNKKNLETAAKELCFDAKNTPLGTIQAKQILEGYDALNKISDILQRQKNISPELIEACNNFYTKIPHDFGRKTPTVLTTMHQVKEKLSMLQDLSQICLALDVLNSSADSSQHIIDKYYKRLECNITPLDSSSDTFQVLKKCLIETHGPTHSAYKMELVDAFICEKTEESVLFKNLGNNKLLWHGSRLTNWIGILKNGLQIAPPEAPSTGYMFGKGIYFADCSSKSANYCFATKKSNEGLLLLSEVSLGSPLTTLNVEDYSCLLDDRYNSVFAGGQNRPEKFEKTILSSEALVPVGPIVHTEDLGCANLIYNEYVVYDVHQVKLKYLLKVKFHF